MGAIESMNLVLHNTCPICSDFRIYREAYLSSLLMNKLYLCVSPSTGAVLEGFLRFPETTQDFPLTMGAPLFSYNVSRGIHSGLNSGVNWPLFQLLVKEMQ